ncbi:hypothetical protein [Cytobacillus firmus]|uniref:hypothetical protein n=1 Tax=Cytobacillus firmus TaxID=1399 RepID=UPI0024950E8B|nr:hypothetical protein [Cytobacillus firmus]
MICLCEELSLSCWGLDGKIAILEDKHTVLKNFGLNDGNWLSFWNIDSRLLTMLYQSLDSKYDWFIVVYDYEKFSSDIEIKEAIILHEIGHITYPAGKDVICTDTEVQCDRIAFDYGQEEGIKKVLDLTLKMAYSLNNEMLLNMTEERQKHYTLYKEQMQAF